MVRNNLAQHVHAACNQLSSYTGADMERKADQAVSQFTTDELVMLASNDLVGFGTISEVFKAQMAAGRIFQLTVVGHATADETFYLNPSNRIAESDNGHPISGKGIGGNTITFSGEPGGANAVRNFYRALAKTPYSVLGVKLTSSDTTQLNKAITVTDYPNGPFNNGISDSVFPATFIDEYAQRTDMITIARAFNFDYNTDIVMSVLATKTIVITIVLGARLDIAAALKNSASRALAQNEQPAQIVLNGNIPQIMRTPKAPVQNAISTLQLTRPGAMPRVKPLVLPKFTGE